MSAHVDWLRAFADSVDRIIKSCEGRPERDYVAEYQKPKRDNLQAAADHLERCEKLLAAYYASHSDPKFGPCDCEACLGYRKARGE